MTWRAGSTSDQNNGEQSAGNYWLDLQNTRAEVGNVPQKETALHAIFELHPLMRVLVELDWDSRVSTVCTCA